MAIGAKFLSLWPAAVAGFLLAFGFAGQPVRAADNAMSFVRLGADDGMSQGAVMSILQDTRGFVWLGTEDGLNRFDGNDIKHYLRDRDSADALPNNWISALAQDAGGRLWIGTDGGGLVWRDGINGRFQRLLGADGKPVVDSQLRIRSLKVDRRKRLWVATRNVGIVVVDVSAGTARKLRHDPTNPVSLSDNSVFELDEDAKGVMWAATGSGLDRIDLGTNTITRFGERLTDAAGIAGRPLKLNSVHVAADGVVWAGSDQGLFRLRLSDNRVERFSHDAKTVGALPGNRVNVLFADDQRRLWVGTSAGLALYQPRSNNFAVFRHDPANTASLPDSNIVSLYQDRSGLLWIGTKTGGVARWNPRAWAFGHHHFDEAVLNQVTAFAVDQQDALWLGSFGGGISRMDRRTGVVTRYTTRSAPPRKIVDDNVMALVVDDNNRVWLGTMGAGVEMLDLRTRTLRRFAHNPDDSGSLPALGVMSLLKASNNAIWVGTYGGGVARIDARTGVVTRFPVSRDGGPGLSSDRATALAEDRLGFIWIGTDGGGLNVLDPLSGEFRRFVHDAANPKSLAADTVYAIHVDSQGIVWVGSRGGGLDRVQGDPFGNAGLQFENFSENDGLPNNTVYGIRSDKTGRIWISTNRGIAAIQPANRVVRTYRRSHGLQGDEFNFGAHFQDSQGRLYFGGSNGYNAFRPDELRANNRAPQVQLTEILKLNTPASATPETLSNIGLGFRDDVVTFRFAALDFTGPAENRYQYRLDGFDNQWIDAGYVGQATYTNLDGGDYRLRVRAANSDGVWNENGLTLGVKVQPPPWASVWAKLLYVVLAAMALAGAWLAPRRRLQREAQYARRLEAEVEQRTTELAEQNVQLEKMNKQLQEASITDPLTGLGNRRCLRDAMQAGNSLPSGQRRSDGRGAVMMVIDLDYLKPINDEHGHDGGDTVLVRVAEILRQIFRSTDLIVRWGGDEFVVLCRDCDLSKASELAELVRSTVAKTVFNISGGAIARTSTSIGFATAPFVVGSNARTNWEESLNIADAALYRAKKQRNTWLGWSGTRDAAGLPSIIAAIDADADDLERKGLLTVVRGSVHTDDTIYRLRARLGPNMR